MKIIHRLKNNKYIAGLFIKDDIGFVRDIIQTHEHIKKIDAIKELEENIRDYNGKAIKID